MGSKEFASLLKDIRSCKICEEYLPLGPRPILEVSESARIMLIGQAPGTKVHASGIPWDDPSGKRLRKWLDLEEEVFYDTSKIAIMPMGFCYPGKGKSGDLPPRKECAEQWHDKVLSFTKNIELFLLIGSYAIKHYMPEAKNKSIKECIKTQSPNSKFRALVHPSPRNIRWFMKNQWFEEEYLPGIQREVKKLI